MVKITKNHKKNWTKEHEDLLLESYGATTVKWIADRLGRTEASVKQKMQLLTGSYDMSVSGGMLPPSEVALALGVDYRTLMYWISNHSFPAKRLHEDKNEDKSYRYFIDPSKAWKWIKKNKERVSFVHYKNGILLPEPDWLDEEIIKANKNILKRPTNWTQGEDDAAWFWYQGGMGYRQIATRLRRPESGTQRRLTTIKKNKQKTNDN